MKVLSTKLLDQKTIAYAHSLNLEVISAAFIEVTGVEIDIHSIPLEKFDAIVFTSANAVKYFLQQPGAFDLLKGKKILSLSGKTSVALLANGIQPHLTATNAENLAHFIVQNKIAQTVLHVCGNLVLDILKEKLKVAGIAYEKKVVYQTILQKDLVVNEAFDFVMFLSPSAVESFYASNQYKNETICCCIGTTTAIALREKFPKAKIIYPKAPSTVSMLDAIVCYSKTKKNTI